MKKNESVDLVESGSSYSELLMDFLSQFGTGTEFHQEFPNMKYLILA